MPKAHSHTLRKRHYAGEEEATNLAEWLNKKGESESKRRIGELVRDVHELRGMSAPSESRVDFQRGSRRISARVLYDKEILAEAPMQKRSKELRQRNRNYLNLYARINRRLASYSMIPVFANLTEFGWTVEWRPISDPRIDYLDRATRRKNARQPLDESLAVLDIAELSRLGLITRVRNCSHCGKWLFARFRHQLFCGKSCQLAHYWKSESGKAQRRNYMRRYRRIKSLSNVK
jgi:hypothetical protein